MTITTRHPESRHGMPVMLDASGAVLTTSDGVRAVRRALGLSTGALADACGVSRRTVEGWEQGRKVDAAPLNVMADLLVDEGREK